MKETYANLLKAIAGESLARNKYTYYAKIARKEGHIWIATVFEETADNERAHAEEELEQIKEKVEMTNTYDIHPLSTTLENLKFAAEGEEYEFGTMYPDFAKIADEEGLKEIALLFRKIAEVETKHAERYRLLEKMVKEETLYDQEEEIEWKCLNCGYVHKGKKAPGTCPLCKKPQGWYKGLKLLR